MRMASSMATQDRGSGMGHQQGFRAAVIGRRLVNNAQRTSGIFAGVRGLILGAAAILAASAFSTPSQAQSGPFNGLAGVWSGAGSVISFSWKWNRSRAGMPAAIGKLTSSAVIGLGFVRLGSA